MAPTLEGLFHREIQALERFECGLFSGKPYTTS